jgi:hypothetical protein
MKYQGHLPDGSSVQKHSAGGLYPYVLVVRDSKFRVPGVRYDYGVMGPGILGVDWVGPRDAAVSMADAYKRQYNARVLK